MIILIDAEKHLTKLNSLSWWKTAKMTQWKTESIFPKIKKKTMISTLSTVFNIVLEALAEQLGKKMVEVFEYMFLPRRYANGWKAHEKMLKIISH